MQPADKIPGTSFVSTRPLKNAQAENPHKLPDVKKIDRSTDDQFKNNLNTKTGGRFLNRLIEDVKSYYKVATKEKNIMKGLLMGVALTLWPVLAVVGGVVGFTVGAAATLLTVVFAPFAPFFGICVGVVVFSAIAGIPVHLGVKREKFPLLHKIHYKFLGPQFKETVKEIREEDRNITHFKNEIQKAKNKIKSATSQIEKAERKSEFEGPIEFEITLILEKKRKESLERDVTEHEEHRTSSIKELVKNNLLLFEGFEKGLIKIRDKTCDYKGENYSPVMKLLIVQMYESYKDEAKADIILKLKTDTSSKIGDIMKTLEEKEPYQIGKLKKKVIMLYDFIKILSELQPEQNSSNK